MIKISELRLGNWVHYRDDDINDPIKISFPYLEKCNLTPEKFHSIPVTPDILEKSGFAKNEDLRYSNVVFFKKNNFIITQVRDIWEISYGMYGNVALIGRYKLCLHHLQNIYFAITEQELEVIL